MTLSSSDAYDLAMEYIGECLSTYPSGPLTGHGARGTTEFDREKIGELSEYVWSKFEGDEEQAILHAWHSMQTEYTRGARCRVCGRTGAQNKALGYDCAREC